MIINSILLNSFIWATDGILKGTTTPVQSGPRSNGNEGVLNIPQIPRQEPHHQMQFNVISKIHFVNEKILFIIKIQQFNQLTRNNVRKRSQKKFDFF